MTISVYRIRVLKAVIEYFTVVQLYGEEAPPASLTSASHIIEEKPSTAAATQSIPKQETQGAIYF